MPEEPVSISALWAEGRGRPLFLATGAPALSWQITTDAPGWTQQSYELEVRSGSATHTARIESAESQNEPWPTEPLTAYAAATVRVRVTGADGSRSNWSRPHALRTGPLGPPDWSAAFITPDALDAADRSTIRFRTVIVPLDRVLTATLSITAHGLYEAVINGQVVGDEVLTPGWISYNDRLTFQSYDVTDLLASPGEPTVLGATVAEGWYGERFGFDGNFERSYPGPIAFAAQLHLYYADGSSDTVTTDGSWTATVDGPVVASGIYPGEIYDARLEDQALVTAGTAFARPLPVRILETDVARLTPSFAPPVRRIEQVAPVSITRSPSGQVLVDFGQNLVGWLCLSVDAPAGQEITLRHAEVLEYGELGVRPLRFAAATDRYIAAGAGPIEWSPRFTFHGFRYAEVSGWPGELGLERTVPSWYTTTWCVPGTSRPATRSSTSCTKTWSGGCGATS